MDATDPELLKIESRLTRVITPPAIAGALVVHLTLLAWCWKDRGVFLPALAVTIATLFLNGPPMYWVARRWGRQASEAARSVLNVAGIAWLGHLIGWGLPVWAFLTYFALPFDGFADRTARPRLALQVAAVDLIGILDGGSPWLAAVFSLLALLAFVLAEVRTRVIRDLYLETRSQRDALDSAHRALTERSLELRSAHKKMNEFSRKAGMAEVATGILHNVGNTLNSVNVSAGVVVERVRQTKLASLARVNQLLLVHSDNLSSFLTEDPKGRHVPRYLAAVHEHLEKEQKENLGELEHLVKKVDHIKAIVAMQQDQARVSGQVEETTLGEVIDDALRLQGHSFLLSNIALVRQGDAGVKLVSEPHKILQILVNLLGNARHALVASTGRERRLTIRVLEPAGRRVQLQVSDNGIGIPAENMTRIFSQGFSTKKDGHGFGLHMSAISANSLGGSLTASSEGPDRGATFTLELPLELPHELHHENDAARMGAAG